MADKTDPAPSHNRLAECFSKQQKGTSLQELIEASSVIVIDLSIPEVGVHFGTRSGSGPAALTQHYAP